MVDKRKGPPTMHPTPAARRKRQKQLEARVKNPKRRGRGVDLNTTSLMVLLQERRYTREYLASQIGVSARTVFAWLSSERNPTEENVRKMAAVLDVPYEQLLMTSQELVERSRHTRVVRFHQRELLGHNEAPTYDEAKRIEDDLQDAAERDASEAEVKKGDITVPSSLDASSDSKSDAEEGDVDEG